MVMKFINYLIIYEIIFYSKKYKINPIVEVLTYSKIENKKIQVFICKNIVFVGFWCSLINILLILNYSGLSNLICITNSDIELLELIILA